jgi:hypothetical protein
MRVKVRARPVFLRYAAADLDAYRSRIAARLQCGGNAISDLPRPPLDLTGLNLTGLDLQGEVAREAI